MHLHPQLPALCSALPHLHPSPVLPPGGPDSHRPTLHAIPSCIRLWQQRPAPTQVMTGTCILAEHPDSGLLSFLIVSLLDSVSPVIPQPLVLSPPFLCPWSSSPRLDSARYNPAPRPAALRWTFHHWCLNSHRTWIPAAHPGLLGAPLQGSAWALPPAPTPPRKAPIPEVLLELKCLQCTLRSSNALRARPPGAHAPWEDRPFHRLSGARWDSGSRAGPSPRNPSEDGPTLSPLLPPRGALLSCENCPLRGG